MNRQFNLYYLHWWTLTHFLFEDDRPRPKCLNLIRGGGALEPAYVLTNRPTGVKLYFAMMKTTLFVLAVFVMVFGSSAADYFHRRDPIENASDATKRAVAWANRETRKFGVKPFTEKSGTAIYDGKRWVWRACVGRGTGDLEVIVFLAPSGGLPNTRVNHLVNAVRAL